MKITLVLKDSIYDCKIIITDSRGERHYYISALCDEEASPPSVIADVFDHDFSLSLIPVMTDTKAMLNEIEENGWKDKLAKKATRFFLNAVDKMLLRIRCSYRIADLQDGDHLDICLQRYAFGTFDRFNIFEWIPMCYTFFEVFYCDNRFKLIEASETNRKDLLKYAKNVSLICVLGEGIIEILFSYPIQMGRIKWLSGNRKILKTLTKFNNFSDAERQHFLEKQEKFFDR